MITSPYERAADLYEREYSPRTFEEDLDTHLKKGFLYNTPASFIMGRPVDRFAPGHYVLDPAYSFDPSDCNAWLIWLAAGDLREFFLRKPFHLAFVGWQRDNQLRWYEMDRVERKILCIR